MNVTGWYTVHCDSQSFLSSCQAKVGCPCWRTDCINHVICSCGIVTVETGETIIIINCELIAGWLERQWQYTIITIILLIHLKCIYYFSLYYFYRMCLWLVALDDIIFALYHIQTKINLNSRTLIINCVVRLLLILNRCLTRWCWVQWDS